MMVIAAVTEIRAAAIVIVTEIREAVTVIVTETREAVTVIATAAIVVTAIVMTAAVTAEIGIIIAIAVTATPVTEVGQRGTATAIMPPPVGTQRDIQVHGRPLPAVTNIARTTAVA